MQPLLKQKSQAILKPQTSRGQARREAVLRASAEEFLKNGYERATIASITKKAGGSTATLYSKFGGKAGLFAEVVAEGCRELEQSLAECDLDDKGVEEGLLLFSNAYLKLMLSVRVVSFFRLVISESKRFPEIRTPLIDGTLIVVKKLTIFIERHNHRDGLEVDDPHSAAMMFVSLLRGRFYLANFELDSPAATSAIDDFILEAVHFFQRAYSSKIRAGTTV